MISRHQDQLTLCIAIRKKNNLTLSNRKGEEEGVDKLHNRTTVDKGYSAT